MGLDLSKFSKADSPKPTKKGKVLVNDPRSPTGEISRTPIVVEKQPYLETDMDEVLDFHETRRFHKTQTLRTRLLKNLMQDPRSPTDGIERTPIVINTSSETCESPISVYSSYANGGDSFVDITAPPDPSVIVSDFDQSKSFVDDLDKFVYDVMNIDFDALLQMDEKEVPETELAVSEKPKEVQELYFDDLLQMDEKEEPETKLTVSEKPNTQEAQKLLHDIMYGEELPPAEVADKETPNKAKLSKIQRRADRKLSLLSGKVGKPRTPLSNITSSANSPSQLSQSKASVKRTKIMSDPSTENIPHHAKIMSDLGVENQGRHAKPRVALWDNDNTVII